MSLNDDAAEGLYGASDELETIAGPLETVIETIEFVLFRLMRISENGLPDLKSRLANLGTQVRVIQRMSTEIAVAMDNQAAQIGEL